MNWKRILPISMVALLLLVMTGGLLAQPAQSLAQGPDPQAELGGVEGGMPQAPLGSGISAPLNTGFTYQGQLKDGGGSAIDDNCDFTFGLWDAEAGGTQVGSDCVVTGVTVTDGYFAALVNSGGEFGAGAFAGEARWLEIAVQCTADPAPVTLSPRQLLSATPYAVYALSVGAHDHWGETWSGSGTGLTLSGGDIGLDSSGADYGVVGQSDSETGRGVFGYNTASAGHAYGVYGQSASSAGGRGVHGYVGSSTGSTYGVYGQSASTSGTGVYGYTTAATGSPKGVYGIADATGGVGVQGFATSSSGFNYGVVGWSDSSNGTGVLGYARADSGSTYGVEGLADSTEGYGVYGYAQATSGDTRGLFGESDSTAGTGVYGKANAASGATYGVYGWSESASGTGVYGSGPLYGVRGNSDATNGTGTYGRAWAASGTTYGVYGRSDSSSGYGVFGYASQAAGQTFGVWGETESPISMGVYGYAKSTTGIACGVYGHTETPTGFGVYYHGGLGGTGLKTSIVETQDYAWRQVYSVESPDVLFEDVGTAQLVDGRAEVTIDPIFAQTVNVEDPYQVFLTPQGDCGLYVAQKTATSFTVQALDGNRCSIAFDYRIIAKRLGYEDTRLAPAEDPALVMPESGPEVRP